MKRLSIVCCAALGLTLSACAGGAEDASETAKTHAAAGTLKSSTVTSSSPTVNAPATQTTSVPPTSSAAETTVEPADTEAPQTAFTTGEVRVPPQGAELVIQDVRAGTHDSYDRVVFEFSGTGLPGYTVGYTPEPRQQASGHLMEVPGTAFLEVMIHGTPMMQFSPREDLVRTGPVGVGAGHVVNVVHGGVFEAETQYVIGLDSTRPYAVYVLENPTRVVVDFQR